jgi:hypothetical protein
MMSKYLLFLGFGLSFIFVYCRSVINTWDKDWKRLKWGQVPDQLQASRYLKQVEKEEWEDEMLMEWTKRRRVSIEDEDEFHFI